MRSLLLAGLVFAAGCGQVAGMFNPEFLTSLGAGEQVALLPGQAPAVLLEVENSTGRLVEFQLTWRDQDGQVEVRSAALAAGDKWAESAVCTVQDVTLGDVGNPNAVGAIIRLGSGAATDAYLEIEPFGSLLREGINYDCGDQITFKIVGSSETSSGYQIFAFIRRSGLEPG